MKVLYIIWEAFATEDIHRELVRRGYEVDHHRVSRKENTDSIPRKNRAGTDKSNVRKEV